MSGESVDKCTKAYFVFQVSEHCFDSLKWNSMLRRIVLEASSNGKYYLLLNDCDRSGYRTTPTSFTGRCCCSCCCINRKLVQRCSYLSKSRHWSQQLFASLYLCLFICSIGVASIWCLEVVHFSDSFAAFELWWQLHWSTVCQIDIVSILHECNMSHWNGH